MPAGHAVAGQWVGQHFRPRPGKQPFQCTVGDRCAHQRASGKKRVPPLAGKQQQAGQQGAEKQLRAEIAQPGHQYHGAVDGLAAMLLHQCHHALVELVQVRPAEE